MPHVIPSCWRMTGKDSVLCGAKGPVQGELRLQGSPGDNKSIALQQEVILLSSTFPLDLHFLKAER